MSSREFIALGTSSQVPTRERSHNGSLLRWEGKSILLDPGEGVQRQLTLAGVPACSIHYVCITHLHGDHCLGLAGIVQRLSLECCGHPVHIFFPESGRVYVERLCSASIYQRKVEVVLNPVPESPGAMTDLIHTDQFTIKAHSLSHSVPTIGFRLEEPAGIRFVPDKLDLAGVYGPMVGELQRKGSIKVEGRTVRLEEVTVPRPGNVFAFIMDTKPCPGAVALAKDADLMVMEATYTSEHQERASYYCHSTAVDAAQTALAAGAHRLAMTHFSQRYSDSGRHLSEARSIFPNTVALNDLDRIEITRRNSI